MPWTHCDRENADDALCACGLKKEQWTVEFNTTRRFVLRRANALHVVLVDARGAAVPAETWRAEFPGLTETQEGTLDEDGGACITCPGDATSATIVFPNRRPGAIARDDGGAADGAEDEDRCAFTSPSRGLLSLRLAREVTVRLQLDPEDPRTEDDRYTLLLEGDRDRWSCTLTPKDDAEPGDRWLTLRYGRLPADADARFTLEIDPGHEGGPYRLFEGLSYEDLIAGPRKTAPAPDPSAPRDLHAGDRRPLTGGEGAAP